MAKRKAAKKNKNARREDKLMDFSTSSKGRHVIAGIVIAVVIVGLVLFSQGFAATGAATATQYGDIEKALQELEAGVAEGKIGRDDYLPAEVYQNLPPFPRDFWSIYILFASQRLSDLKPYGPEYWKQPEWYPTWVAEGVSLHANPPTGRYGIWGFGAYPGDQGYTSLPGDEFTAITYFHSSWVIQSYQGMWLRPVFPSSGIVGDVSVEYQNPDEVRKYFDVTITPDIFVLGPSFPIFDENWARRIEVHVQIAPDTPPGEYLIGVNPTWPPDDADQEFLQQYKLRYARAGSTGVDRPFFQMAVEVRNPANE